MTKLVKSLWALVLFWLPAFVYWIRIMLWYSSDQEAAGKQHVAWHTLIKHSFRKVQPPQEFSYRHSSLNFVVFQWFLSLKRFPFNHITAYHCEPGLHGAPESMWSPKQFVDFSVIRLDLRGVKQSHHEVHLVAVLELLITTQLIFIRRWRSTLFLS